MTAIDDIKENELPSQEELQSISFLAQAAKEFEIGIATHTTELKDMQAALRKILEEDIPQAMLEAGGGITSCKMKDGTKIDVIPFVNASISVANRPRAFAWMRENGYGDLIKRTISAKFGMGDDDDATKVLNYLVDEGLSVDDKEAVHPSTLKSQVKGWDEEGQEFPEELFGIYRGMTTKIKAG